MFSAPHSLLMWRRQGKPKVVILRRYKTLLPAVPPVGARAQARAVLGNSGGRIAVAADYLLGSELTASRRQSGRAGPNAASGRNVGQVCVNSAAAKLHHWFSWATLTKCRCSEIVLGDPNT